MTSDSRCNKIKWLYVNASEWKEVVLQLSEVIFFLERPFTSSRTSASLLRMSSCRPWNVGTLQEKRQNREIQYMKDPELFCFLNLKSSFFLHLIKQNVKQNRRAVIQVATKRHKHQDQTTNGGFIFEAASVKGSAV